MLPKLTTAAALAAIALALPLVGLGAGVAHAEQKNGSGPTQSQIDCQNHAVNDYWDQIKECDKALSDLPADNQQCHNDAASDLHNRKAACVAQMTTGGQSTQGTLGTGTVLDPGQGTIKKKQLQFNKTTKPAVTQ